MGTASKILTLLYESFIDLFVQETKTIALEAIFELDKDVFADSVAFFGQPGPCLAGRKTDGPLAGNTTADHHYAP